jgi:hypothetical protein
MKPACVPAHGAIAGACFLQAATLGTETEPVYQETSPQQSHGPLTRGEIRREEVAYATRSLEAERVPIFRPFWTWRLECAEADLWAAADRAKEQRGE